jgi:sulfonate transport system substrate-binding protein
VTRRRHRIRGRVALALTALTLGSVTSSPVAAAAAALQTSIPYDAGAIGAAPLWVAMDNGLFRRYGIDASRSEASQSSPAIMASMLSGESPFATIGEDAVISADLNGADIAIVASGPEKLFFKLFATPKIHSVADLKGKKIGISKFGSTTQFVARYILTVAGLDPKTDVTLVPAGSQSNRLAALTTGMADAVVLGPPITVKARALGFNPIADMLDAKMLYYTSALAAKRSWVKAHPAETLNVVRAFAAGVAMIRTDKKAALAALAAHTGTTEPQVLEDAYRSLLKTLPKIPTPQVAALKTGLAASRLAGAKHADPARFIDAAFVDELERSGFIAGLYK